MRILIKNGYVVSMVSEIRKCDILIEDDRITKYFTYEFMDYVRLVIEYKREVDARKILSYLPELEDEEKNKNIRKIVKKIDDESNRKYGV